MKALSHLTFVQFADSTLLLFKQPDLELDAKLMFAFLSQGPLSLLPSMDSSSVNAAMVSFTTYIKQ